MGCILVIFLDICSVLGSQALETPQPIFRELMEPDWAWLLQPSPEPSPEHVESDLALHQSLPEPSPGSYPEPSPEPRWTWPGSAPKPPGALSGTFSLLRNLFGNLLNLTWLCTKASQTFSGIFSRTFSGSLFPRPSPEPSPEPRWTWPGACTSAHRSYSGLKTPLAYAVGE